MNNTIAIFIKQMQSLLKNPVMLISAVIYVALVLVITLLMGEDPGIDDCDVCIPAYICEEHIEAAAPLDTPRPSFAGLFAVMFLGLSMIGSSSALILEDKSTQNLRFLAMADVKPKQYMVGTASGLAVMSFSMLILFALVGRYFGEAMLWFLSVAMSGALVSILLGIMIGMSKYPILATPISVVFGLGPMLSTFNENLARILRFTYTQQVNLAFSDLHNDLANLDFSSNFTIIGANGAVFLLIFIWLNRKGTLVRN